MQTSYELNSRGRHTRYFVPRYYLNDLRCGDNPHCNNVTQLCLQMEQDLASATLLNKLYKKRIALVSPRLDKERNSGKVIIFLPNTTGHSYGIRVGYKE